VRARARKRAYLHARWHTCLGLGNFLTVEITHGLVSAQQLDRLELALT